MPSEMDATDALGEGGSPQADVKLAENFGMTIKQIRDFDPQTLDVTRACKFLGLPLKRFDSLAGQPEARDRWVSTIARERKELIELFPHAGKELKEMLEAIRKFALRKCLKPDSPALVDGLSRGAATANRRQKVPAQWLIIGGTLTVALLVIAVVIGLVSTGRNTVNQASNPTGVAVAGQSPSSPTSPPTAVQVAANDTGAKGQSPSGPAATPTVPGDGEVFVLINKNSGRCLTVRGASKEAGAYVVQGVFAAEAGSAEQWKAVKAGEGYKLVNQNSGKVLAVPSGAKHATNIIQWDDLDDGDSKDQRWEFIKSDNHYTLKSQCSGLLLAVAGGSKEENHRVIHYEPTKSDEQLWLLQRVRAAGKK